MQTKAEQSKQNILISYAQDDITVLSPRRHSKKAEILANERKNPLLESDIFNLVVEGAQKIHKKTIFPCSSEMHIRLEKTQ